MSDISVPEPTLVGTSSAVQRARRKGSVFRPGTVSDVTQDRSSATVVDDQDINSQGFPCQIIAPTHIAVGDRVMVHYNPPHGSQIVGLLRGGYEPWTIFRIDAGSTPGNLGVGWTNAGGTGYPGSATWPFASYRRRSDRVELRGRLQRVSGSGDLMAWLPSPYWPRNDLLFPVLTAPIAAAGAVRVNTDGGIRAVVAVPDSGGFVTLDGISYSVE